MTDLSSIGRPNSVSIFSADPAGVATFLAFVLNNTTVPAPNRVRLDLTKDVTVSRKTTPARSPLLPLTTGAIRKDPIMVQVRGSLSATPLDPIGIGLGTFGSAVRRDLRERDKLYQIQDRGEPVTVVTPIGIFPSMSMSIEEVGDGTHKVELVLSFEEIRIVTPVSLAGVVDLETALAGADAPTAQGATAATATTTSLPAGGLG